MNIAKIVKLLMIGFLLMLFFHPVATVIFIASHFGVLFCIGMIYTIIRITLGMSIISFISKELKDD